MCWTPLLLTLSAFSGNWSHPAGCRFGRVSPILICVSPRARGGESRARAPHLLNCYGGGQMESTSDKSKSFSLREFLADWQKLLKDYWAILTSGGLRAVGAGWAWLKGWFSCLPVWTSYLIVVACVVVGLLSLLFAWKFYKSRFWPRLAAIVAGLLFLVTSGLLWSAIPAVPAWTQAKGPIISSDPSQVVHHVRDELNGLQFPEGRVFQLTGN